MTDPQGKADLIAKLLAKAEAAGTTPEERDTLAEKAADLMIKYGIDEAVARAAQTGQIRAEQIVSKIFNLDVPKTYSHEFALLGTYIAKALGCQAFLDIHSDYSRRAHIVGFESDVALVTQLYTSLVRQCTLNLAVWYRTYVHGHPSATGSDKYNAKRGFVHGFATGVEAKMRLLRKEAIHEAGTGAELVLVDRNRLVKDWLDSHFNLRKGASRAYDPMARGAGFRAGQSADVGQKTVGSSVRGPRALGS